MKPDWQDSGLTRTAVFDSPTGVAHCMFCPSRHLRLSRMRFQDIKSVLVFQFPVRCGRCGQRQYTAPLIAALAGFHQVMRSPRRRKPDSSWASWTDTDPNETNRIRPITTVMGTKAANLSLGPHKQLRKPAKHDDSIW